MNKWYYVADGRSYGPVATNDLKGRITEETQVWKQGMSEWQKAKFVDELAHLFGVTPPPIPEEEKGTESSRAKGIEKLNRAVDVSWIFMLGVILQIGLEYFGKEGTRIDHFVTLAVLAAVFRLLTGWKSYLTKVIGHSELTANLNWVVFTLVPLYLFDLLETNGQRSDQFYGVAFLAMVVIYLLSSYYSFRLAGQLKGIKQSGISSFRTFAYLKFFYGLFIGVGLIVLFSQSESFINEFFSSEDSLTLSETIIFAAIELLPYYFLQKGLLSAQQKYVVQPAG